MMSVVEDVLKQQGKRLNDMDLASRKAEEAGDLDSSLFLSFLFFFFFFGLNGKNEFVCYMSSFYEYVTLIL